LRRSIRGLWWVDGAWLTSEHDRILQLPFALQFLVVIASGWVNRRQQLAIEYLLEENRVLREQLGSRRLRLTDA
jgi:hypothetical protein